MRRNRADRKSRGIPERRRKMVWRVEPELVVIPDWARRRAIKGLSTGSDYIWLRRGDARALERLDREAGGEPRSFEAEFRRCKVCRRPLIGEEAIARRLGEQGGMTSWMLPCGDECYEAQRDGRWREVND